MRLLRHLTGRHRTPVTNRTLGLLLAFNAGMKCRDAYSMIHVIL